MCNLYSITKGQQAIRLAFRAMQDRTGNLPSRPALFPDQIAPVIRSGPTGRTLDLLRWGFPPPPGLPAPRPVTNIRNTASAYWRDWLQPQNRCLIPVTAFCEYSAGPPVVPHWFALDESRPLFAFAGLWRPWSGRRGTKAAPADGEHEVFAFLTCAPNAVVRPIHPKAMPVLLTEEAEYETWLSAPVEEAMALQRPLPDGRLRVVASGAKQDSPEPVEAMRPAQGMLF